ncbi:MAG: Asp-tRNA(Asn)/Glu-tRNA(Gln) amidotransferase subunit GatB [Candidatus Magasanikbacteria bacterium]|nr:Asp-tRNA(Asn)/Glu-tRNA(Gln) amidotransferase subunit GatB [Candidatus Magasanikbacteria bacterium]
MYQTIIGMEVHVELKTNSKMFCSCKNNPDENEPNKNVCEICLGHPGTLPTANKKAIAWTVKIGKALGCSIREVSKFDRKHYFYPDLPKAYQISQFDEPIAEHGEITLTFETEENVRDTALIEIERVHLEEDTAKLTHDKEGNTLADFNRASTPLVEIVSRPDFKTPLEAKTYCQELRSILRYLNVSDANMEKGLMRCEANISVQEAGKFEIVDGVVKPLGDYVLNSKVEVKNLNSFKAVEKALEFEIAQQTKMLENGENWEQQTKGWDAKKQETIPQRKKESAHDYRYFPEPDIPPFHPLQIAGEISLPELPIAKRKRFHTEYGFSYSDSKILTNDKEWADFTERVMSELVDWLHSLPEIKGDSNEIMEEKRNKIARLCGGWLTSKLMGEMINRKMHIKTLAISPENFAELVALVYAERINSTNALKLLGDMLNAGTDIDPTQIMEEKGYGQINDEGKLGEIIENVIRSYPDQVEQFKQGKEPILKFLIGMAMKASEGSADPKVLEKMLREKLK